MDEQTQNADTAQTPPSADDLQKAIAEKDAELSKRIEEIDHLKKSQSGSDKAVKELQRELSELKKKSMDESERIAYEKQQLANEQAEKDAELAAAKAEALRAKFVAENGLPPAYLVLLRSDTVDGLKREIEEIKKLNKAEYERGLKEGQEMAKAKPGSGSGEVPTENPFIPGPHYSVGKQTELYRTNRALYDRLKAEASAKK